MRRFLIPYFCPAFALLLSHCGSKKEETVDFATEIEPALAKYCYECHAQDADEGGIDFDSFASHEELLADRGFWEDIYVNIDSTLMPPADEPQPDEAKREKIIAFIEREIFKLDPNNADPGKPVVSRLNRDEYDRTVRDLFGTELEPARTFPEDDTGYGFDNIGSVLTLSPSLMEKYFRASSEILDQVIVTEPPAPKVKRFEGGSFSRRNGGPDPGSGSMASNGTLGVRFSAPAGGEYQIKVFAAGSQAKNEWPIMRIELEKGARKDVRVDSRDQKEFSQAVKLKKGDQRWIDVSFINDHYDPGAKDPNQRDRNLRLHRIEVIGPIVKELPPPTPAYQKVLALDGGVAKSDEQKARTILTKFAERAWRRPLMEEAEKAALEKVLSFYQQIRKSGGSFDEGMKLALRGILISPRFLFRGEIPAPKTTDGEIIFIDEFALASRLSYFLWSSTPDEELFQLAKNNRLRENLDQQIERMLRDPRADALTENFAGQWLQLRNLNLASPDPKTYRDWNDELKKDMRIETEKFFFHIVNENRPVMDFLDADYSFVNERLARHYGLKNIKGKEFQRISFTEEQKKERGGLMTHASILTITSNPTRTSAVNRGNYVLENLMGTPPPPPPANVVVPDLEEAKTGKDGTKALTLRQQLEIHREDAMCASCHSRMDPIGFAMENYDGIGRWRDKENGHPIDASGELYTGETFQGAAELRKLLAEKKAKSFVRCLTEKMLTYALGRGLEYYDRPAVNKIADTTIQDGARFHSLVKAIANSAPFQKMRVSIADDSNGS